MRGYVILLLVVDRKIAWRQIQIVKLHGDKTRLECILNFHSIVLIRARSKVHDGARPEQLIVALAYGGRVLTHTRFRPLQHVEGLAQGRAVIAFPWTNHHNIM